MNANGNTGLAVVPTQAPDTTATLQAQIDALRAENERLRHAKERALSIRVSEKGAASVYGLGRWPVTLYKSQWRRLLAYGKSIESFLVEQDANLTDKADAV